MPVPIRWGKRVARKKRRSIRLGSYDHGAKVIRVHPSLDRAHVPAFFIQSIIYHEYLHHVLGAPHNARFHRYEQRFRYYRESKQWLKRNLHSLLGRRMPRPPVALRAPKPVQPQQLTLF